MTSVEAIGFLTIVVIAIVSFSNAVVYHYDLKKYEGVMKAMMDDNDKLIEINENLMKHNKELLAHIDDGK